MIGITFYTLLAFLCYCVVSINLYKTEQYRRCVIFSIMVIYYLLLHLLKIDGVLDHGSLMWALFNVALAIFILYESNELVNKK